ncbi:MAG: hypothetical protein IPI25_00005 [Candidatus Brocadia sp.]|nr:MAG: hypothetical protein IPI25_00005 [Candidatus Brocadia sp.]
METTRRFLKIASQPGRNFGSGYCSYWLDFLGITLLKETVYGTEDFINLGKLDFPIGVPKNKCYLFKKWMPGDVFEGVGYGVCFGYAKGR